MNGFPVPPGKASPRSAPGHLRAESGSAVLAIRPLESERRHAIVCVAYQRILQQEISWRHNDREAQWEHGYYDLAYDRFIANAWVTDEMIDRTGFPAVLAVRLWRSVGSVPPPLREHLPPQPPPPALYTL